MDKDKILSYVMHTPGNTNPNVLKTLLDDEEQGGGGSSDLRNKTAIFTFVNDTDVDMSNLPKLESVINENGLVKKMLRSLPQPNATETIATLVVPVDGRATEIMLPLLPMSTTGEYSYIASNAINCELQNEFSESVVITDVALDASITLTITFTAN